MNTDFQDEYLGMLLQGFIDSASQYETEEELLDAGVKELKDIYLNDDIACDIIKEQYLRLNCLRWSDFQSYIEIYNESIWPNIIDRVVVGCLIEADVELDELKNIMKNKSVKE